MARWLCLPIMLSLLAAGLPAWSQAPEKKADLDLSDELDLLMLLNTKITTASKRAERAIEAPSVVSVVTRDQFEGYGWTSVNDALYSLPGFGPSQDYDRRTVSSRGLFEGWNNNHILFLVDGIPFNDNIYGSAYTWEITPVFMIKTLEVVRGPGSALYGSNSTNSATQIKTISARDLVGGGEAQIRIGQKGDRILDFAAGSAGDLVSGIVGFSTYATDGNSYMNYDGSLRTGSDGKLSQFFVNDRRNSHYGWAKLEGQGALAGWTFQAHQQDWNYRTGHGWIWMIPDQGEDLQEKRQIYALSYSGKLNDSWSHEYMLRYQRHDLAWNVRFFPNAPPDMPYGMSEVLDTGAQDWFARAQWNVDFKEGANFLFGVESTRFLYTGDRTHYGVNYDFSTYTPAEGVVPAGPWLEFIKDKPVTTTGYYGQFSSGALFGNAFKLVLGLRYDKSSMDYVKIYDEGRPTASKSYSNTSPRVSLIFTPKKNLAIKVMYGTAFRAPAPSEIAGANTYTLASNIEQLKPETLNTMEVAVDWIINNNLNWRTNIYRTKFKDQIGYSLSNANLSSNLYTLTTQGIETELLYGSGSFRGFVNYSYAKRVDEEVRDDYISAEKDRLTWEPASRFKAGVIYQQNKLHASLSMLYQGAVARRRTDVGVQPLPLPDFNVDDYRARQVDAWTSLNAKVGFNVTPQTNLSLVVTNLMDTTKNKLVKTQAFPFDYQGEGRKVSFVVRTTF